MYLYFYVWLLLLNIRVLKNIMETWPLFCAQIFHIIINSRTCTTPFNEINMMKNKTN